MRRRLSVALIAATTSALALTTPAVAQSSGSSLSSSSSSDTEQGSTFMGPGELAESISSGHGSSGVPEDEKSPEDDPEEPPIDLEDFPEWMHGSIQPSEEMQIAFAVLNGIMTIGAIGTQVIVGLAPVIGVDKLRDMAAQFGLRF